MLLGIRKIAFLCSLLCLSGIAQAQELDNRIASMFVFNFTKYIEWPTNSLGSHFVIGVVGNPALVTELNKMIGNRTVAGKPVQVKAMSKANLQEATNCQILIFGSGSCNQVKFFTEAIQTKPVLLVTEKDMVLRRGVGINLILDEDDDFKTKFMLSKSNIEGAGLKVSTSLAALAKR